MKAAIIGGAGRMGQWLLQFLLYEGMDVLVIDSDTSKLSLLQDQPGLEKSKNIRNISSCDVIILSVPIINFDRCVQDIAPYIQDNHLIFDIASLKTITVGSMHKFIEKGTVLGIHPMFGPGVEDICDQNFVLTPTSDKEHNLAERVKTYLEKRNANVILMSPSDHDELMSLVLGLPHFIALVAADTYINLGKISQAEKVSGTTYKRLMDVIKNVVSEDPDFYSYLQTNLPGLSDMQSLFHEKAIEWSTLVQNRDTKNLIEKMSKLKAILIEK